MAELRKLCFVSRGFLEIAVEFLYSHVLVPDGAAARLLCRTLASVQSGQAVIGRATDKIIAATFGGKRAERGPPDATFVRSVLERLADSALSTVVISLLSVPVDALKLCNKVTSLSLDRASLEVHPGVAVVLPGLSTINLNNGGVYHTTAVTTTRTGTGRFGRVMHTFTRTTTQRQALTPLWGLAGLAPNLTRLELGPLQPQSAHGLQPGWDAVPNLRELCLGVSIPHGEFVPAHVSVVRELPRSIRLLEVKGRQLPDEVAEAALEVFTDQFFDRDALKVLQISRTFKTERGGSVSTSVGAAAMAAAASERGIEVEWVWRAGGVSGEAGLRGSL